MRRKVGQSWEVRLMPKTKKSKRGLASADPETRQRVASMGGSSHDQAFFSEIGRKGGASSRRRS